MFSAPLNLKTDAGFTVILLDNLVLSSVALPKIVVIWSNRSRVFTLTLDILEIMRLSICNHKRYI